MAKKIRKAISAPQVTEGNGLLAFAEFVLLPAAGLNGHKELVVDRSRDGLEPLIYSSIEKMRDDYREDVVRRSIAYGKVHQNTNRSSS